MAKKLYVFQQERKFNGETTYGYIRYVCEKEEAAAIVAASDGKISVLEENTELSSAADASTTVTGGLPIDGISMVHSQAKTAYFGGRKPWLFKIATTAVDLQNMFKNHKPFSGAYENEKPDNCYPKLSHMGAL